MFYGLIIAVINFFLFMALGDPATRVLEDDSEGGLDRAVPQPQDSHVRAVEAKGDKGDGATHAKVLETLDGEKVAPAAQFAHDVSNKLMVLKHHCNEFAASLGEISYFTFDRLNTINRSLDTALQSLTSYVRDFSWRRNDVRKNLPAHLPSIDQELEVTLPHHVEAISRIKMMLDENHEMDSYSSLIETQLESKDKLSHTLKTFLDFLTSALGELQGKPVELVTISATELVSSSLNTLRDQKHLKDMNIDDTDITNDVSMLGSDQRLQAIMYNAFGNAINAMQKAKTENPCLKVSLHKDTDGKVVLTFEDNGPGFTDDQLGKFSHHETFTTSADDGKQHGLGMAICRKAANDMNGVMRLEKAEPNGARVIFEFPPHHSTEAANENSMA